MGSPWLQLRFLYSVLYRGLAFEEARQLVHINGTDAARNRNRLDVPFHDFLELRPE